MADNTLLDEYVAWPQEYIDSGRLDNDEGYKSGVGKRLEEARKAVLSRDPKWPALVKDGLAVNLVHWITVNALHSWIKSKPDDALDAMQALWAEDDTPIRDRIRNFVPRVQPGPGYEDDFNGPGTRLRLISVLLMALGPTTYPPYGERYFVKEGYKRTGYPRPPKGTDEAELYEHALGFLDKIVERAAAQGFARPCNRLEAQSVVWAYQDAEKRFGPRNQGAPVETVEEDPPSVSPSPSLDELAEELMFPLDFLKRVEKLLEDKRQVIFQGPPGTGKTYTAKKLAACLAGSEERVRLVQFHPSYAYEDFVQGYRPKLIDGQPGFELKDGPLREMAEMARQSPEQKHFLVIDEINRGNLAKVFGELYFLLEYRGEKTRLQYSESGETFAMPRNLYIIGTMNTADRSIALVDLALRRRFYFVEFHPDEWPVEGLLHRWLEANNSDMEWAAGIVDRANKLLAARDAREAAIGPSYLMKEGLDEDMAQLIWEHNVLPYVEERLYGQTEEQLKEFGFDSLRGRGDSGSGSDEGGGDGENDGSAAGSNDA